MSFLHRLFGGSRWQRGRELLLACNSGLLDSVQQLLANDVDVDWARPSDGATPLSVASERGHADIVQVLLAANADVSKARKANDATPLRVASDNGHARTVEILLAAITSALPVSKRSFEVVIGDTPRGHFFRTLCRLPVLPRNMLPYGYLEDLELVGKGNIGEIRDIAEAVHQKNREQFDLFDLRLDTSIVVDVTEDSSELYPGALGTHSNVECGRLPVLEMIDHSTRNGLRYGTIMRIFRSEADQYLAYLTRISTPNWDQGYTASRAVENHDIGPNAQRIPRCVVPPSLLPNAVDRAIETLMENQQLAQEAIASKGQSLASFGVLSSSELDRALVAARVSISGPPWNALSAQCRLVVLEELHRSTEESAAGRFAATIRNLPRGIPNADETATEDCSWVIREATVTEARRAVQQLIAEEGSDAKLSDIDDTGNLELSLKYSGGTPGPGVSTDIVRISVFRVSEERFDVLITRLHVPGI
jgi:hypothetical protein